MVKVKQAENFAPCIKLTYKRTGAPVDLTGLKAYSQMRTEPNGELVATAQCTVGTQSGRITAVYNSNVTANIPVGEYGYDIWVIPDNDESQKRSIWTERVQIVGRYTDNFGA